MIAIQAAVERLAESYEADGVYRGPCGLCGHPDARHRIIDAWTDRFKAGDALEEIAEDFSRDSYEVAEAVAEALLWDNYARRTRASRTQQRQAEQLFWPVRS